MFSGSSYPPSYSPVPYLSLYSAPPCNQSALSSTSPNSTVLVPDGINHSKSPKSSTRNSTYLLQRNNHPPKPQVSHIPINFYNLFKNLTVDAQIKPKQNTCKLNSEK